MTAALASVAGSSWPAAPALPTITLDGSGALEGADFDRQLAAILPEFLLRQRWFAGKSSGIGKVSARTVGQLPGAANLLLLADVETGDGEKQSYFLPLSFHWNDEASDAPSHGQAIAEIQYGARRATLFDAALDPAFARDLMGAMRVGGDVQSLSGALRSMAGARFPSSENEGAIRPVGVEQSNVSLLVGTAALLKVYRRVRTGVQPEIEVARFLTDTAGYRNTPALLGSMDFVPPSGLPTALAAAFAFAANQGDAWGVITRALEEHLETGSGETAGIDETFGFPLTLPAVLGRRTAEMHAALATPSADPAFAPESVRAEDLGRWADEVTGEARQALDQVARLAPTLSEEAGETASELLRRRSAVLTRLDQFRGLSPSGLRTRIHGDYHLGQVLVTGSDVMIIDFEGEPQRSLEERRAKTSPLRDVAGMLRSFDYAAWAVLDRIGARREAISDPLRVRALHWRATAEREFLEAYWPVASAAGVVPAEPATRDGLLELFLLQKAMYEIGYEAASRPAWLPIPVRGVLGLTARYKEAS